MIIILEGSEDQIQRLKDILPQNYNMPEINANYQTENLWQIEDVQSKFKCTKEEALNLLYAALTDDYIVSQIRGAIELIGEFQGLKRKESKDD